MTTIALAQIQMDDDLQANAERALGLMAEAAHHGAQLICFPELQLSPFFPQHPKQDATGYALSCEDELFKAFQSKCKELNLVAVLNVYLKDGDQYYDASPVIDANGELLGISKMVHIVQTEQFYEQDYYTPSDTGFHTYDTAVGKVGVVICFDRHYPESIRSCVLQGAELIVIPTANTIHEPSELFEWELRIPAFQNGVFLAMCNRVGLEDDMAFCGESLVVNPNGRVIVKTDAKEQLIYTDLDLSTVPASQEKRPFLSLRRPEAFTP